MSIVLVDTNIVSYLTHNPDDFQQIPNLHVITEKM